MYEHLLFFARVKGVPSKVEKDYVNELITLVDLTSKRSTFGPDLSGGQKRRLSLGISLVGYMLCLLLLKNIVQHWILDRQKCCLLTKQVLV